MPRDGTGNYNQPFPNVAPDTTIESIVYNGFVSDVALDLNAARPIMAGGTGAASADDALANLGGEKASQVVTNYDSHVWLPGSFYSAPGATGGPIDASLGGICYMTDDDNITLEARRYVADTTTPTKYVRQKASGVWGAWLAQDPATGGTVTGDVTISKASPELNLNATTASEPVIRGQRSGVTRWGMSFASMEAEGGGGSNTGSDWYLAAFSDVEATFIQSCMPIAPPGWCRSMLIRLQRLALPPSKWSISRRRSIVRPLQAMQHLALRSRL